MNILGGGPAAAGSAWMDAAVSSYCEAGRSVRYIAGERTAFMLADVRRLVPVAGPV